MKSLSAKLKRLHSPDVYDLDSFAPTDQEKFVIFIQAMFGPSEGEGEESFDIIVCNPEWLKQKVAQEKVYNARNHLIVNSFNVNELKEYLNNYAQSCLGRNWLEVAAKLAEIGRWEFADYPKNEI
jgi:Immunity protein 8